MSSIRIVVDSSVLINFLTEGEADKRDNPEWFDRSKWVFEEHARGIHKILMPAIIIAELAGSGKVRGNHIPKQERYRRIKRVREWITASEFQVVEITQSLAEEASGLAIEHQLTGADACILTAAVRYNCPILYTWDEGLLKIGDQVAGVQVQQPTRLLLPQCELNFEE